MDPRKFPSSYHGWLHRNEKGWEEAVEAAVVDNDAVERTLPDRPRDGLCVCVLPYPIRRFRPSGGMPLQGPPLATSRGQA